MALYPLVPPTLPKPDAVSLKPVSAIARVASPFTFQEEVQIWSGQQRILTAQWAGQFREDAEKWEAFFHELNGAEGTFLFPAWWAAEPLGTGELLTGGKNAMVKGAGQTATNTLNTRGWKPNTTVLKAGDYIEVRDNIFASPAAFDDDPPWSDSGLDTIAADTQTDPDGTTTAERLTPLAAQTDVRIQQEPTMPGGVVVPEYPFTVGFWAKVPTTPFTLNQRLANQADVNRGVLARALTTAWAQELITGTMDAADTGIRGYMGGNSTWATADGDVDLWGATLDTIQQSTLYKVVSDVISDASGLATLKVWPKLRRDHGDFARIITIDPQGIFRLVDFPQFDIDDVLLRSFTMTAIEVVP